MKKEIIILLLFVYPHFSSSQGIIDDELKTFFRNESTIAVGITTNGWMVGYQYAKRKDAFHKTLYTAELFQTDHPKEFGTINNITHTAYGKTNTLYSIKLSIGTITEKFSKIDFGAVAVKYYFDAGIVAGFEKPVLYMVEYLNADSTSYEYKLEHFSESNQTKNSVAPFYIGFDEAKFIPGIEVTHGWNFEYSTTDKKVRAIEFGCNLFIYTRKIELLANTNNYWYFATLFINYRFGKIVGYK